MCVCVFSGVYMEGNIQRWVCTLVREPMGALHWGYGMIENNQGGCVTWGCSVGLYGRRVYGVGMHTGQEGVWVYWDGARPIECRGPQAKPFST